MAPSGPAARFHRNHRSRQSQPVGQISPNPARQLGKAPLDSTQLHRIVALGLAGLEPHPPPPQHDAQPPRPSLPHPLRQGERETKPPIPVCGQNREQNPTTARLLPRPRSGTDPRSRSTNRPCRLGGSPRRPGQLPPGHTLQPPGTNRNQSSIGQVTVPAPSLASPRSRSANHSRAGLGFHRSYPSPARPAHAPGAQTTARQVRGSLWPQRPIKTDLDRSKPVNPSQGYCSPPA